MAAFLEAEKPDILLLQEIKCETHQFPAMKFAALGYESVAVGQKSYNGVAVLHRIPVEVRVTKLPGMGGEDAQARYIEVGAGGMVVGNLYLPNGGSGGEAGYAYKLEWMAALRARALELFAAEADFVLAGDYNVCPTDADFAPKALAPGDALIRPETRAAFHALLWTGLTDALRAVQPEGPAYTFWDYQAGAWDRNSGLRIDHALLSPRVAERMTGFTIHKAERGRTQPSDHVPVTVEIV